MTHKKVVFPKTPQKNPSPPTPSTPYSFSNKFINLYSYSDPSHPPPLCWVSFVFREPWEEETGVKSPMSV